MDYINYLPLYGRGALINVVEAPRGVGKTYTAKMWGTRRFMKCGKKFIWVRRTEEETRTSKGAFFKPKMLRALGLKSDDVKIKGQYAYMKRGKRWVDFCEFCSLSNAATQRSVDNEDYDLMFLDEAFATLERVNRYHGDEVRDFIDLYISKKRDHKLIAFLLGNKETYDNPYYQYFNIPAPPVGFEGVRMFNGGTIAVWTVTGYVTDEEHDKVARLLSNTDYGRYMFDGAAKTARNHVYGNPPRGATHYASFDFGRTFTVWKHNGKMYVTPKLDASRVVFVGSGQRGYYNRALLTTTRERWRFSALELAYKRGKVIFQDATIAEYACGVFSHIGIVK